ncbi:Sensory box/GGDEF family protein [Cyclobacterium qasimii M12-11B]|uniref:Sensory box/GGDEF family protein n=2 Tax=Cyclobacterium qasimii TaxID=1350429 RepID=S7WW07_9BACT|nr:Sensory box/GGDEF family protein [Cyclobacterium qasimii M12-11B]
MEFITAILFFLLSLGLLGSHGKSKPSLILYRVSIFCVLVISILTIGQYFLSNLQNINATFEPDTLASNFQRKTPLATAICFLLIGVSILGIQSKSKKVKSIINGLIFITWVINFIAIIIFILNIPSKNADFLIPIPIHSSLIFFFYSGFLLFKNDSKTLNELIFGNYTGSNLIKSSGPFVFGMIMIMGLVLIYLINNEQVDVNVGLIIYSIIAVVFSLTNIFVVAIQLNRSDQEKIIYENALHASIKEIKQYKEALDSCSLVDITDMNGTIISVNDKFCEISKYDRKELIGKTHRVINSGHHSKEFYADLWHEIKTEKSGLGTLK